MHSDPNFTRAQDVISDRLTHRKTLDAILDDMFDAADDAEIERHQDEALPDPHDVDGHLDGLAFTSFAKP